MVRDGTRSKGHRPQDREMTYVEIAAALICAPCRTQTVAVSALSKTYLLTEGSLRGPPTPDSTPVILHSLLECIGEILVGVRRFSSHIHVLGPMGSTRFASWLKFAPGEFVILGVLPATLRIADNRKWSYRDADTESESVLLGSSDCHPRVI